MVAGEEMVGYCLADACEGGLVRKLAVWKALLVLMMRFMYVFCYISGTVADYGSVMDI